MYSVDDYYYCFADDVKNFDFVENQVDLMKTAAATVAAALYIENDCLKLVIVVAVMDVVPLL